MAHSSFGERALYFFGLGLARLIYRVKITGAEKPARGRISAPAESHHVGRCDRPPARLSAADPLHH